MRIRTLLVTSLLPLLLSACSVGPNYKRPAVTVPEQFRSTSAEDAVAAALAWEQDVTRQVGALMDIAVKESDYLAQSFLQWFIDEQLEEVVKMDRLLSVIRQSGEKNLVMVEAYLIHIDKAS